MAKKSVVELELNKVTKVKRKAAEERRAYLIRMIQAFNDITDEQWDTLSSETQQWHNEAIKSWKKTGKPIDFPVVEDDEDEERPVKKRKATRKAAELVDVVEDPVDDDEDDFEEETDVEPEEKPASKKKLASKKKASLKNKSRVKDDEDDETDEEDEDEESAPKKKKATSSTKSKKKSSETKTTRRKVGDDEDDEPKLVDGPGKSLRLKDQIKEHLLVDEKKPVEEIFEAMQEANPNVAISRATIAGISAEYRHTLKFLREHGKIVE